MGLIDNIIQRVADAVSKVHTNETPQWIRASGSVNRHRPLNLAITKNQEQLYLRLSWVHMAIKHLAQQAAGTDLAVKEKVGEKTIGIENHPFEELLLHPNPANSRSELLTAIIGYYALTGNSYLFLNRPSEDSPPDELWVVPSHQIRPVADGNSYLKGYAYEPGDGGIILLETWEIAHFKTFNPLNPYVGASPVEAIAVIAEGDMAMQKWNTNFFGKHNAKMPGILTFADPINNTDWDQIKRDFETDYGGTKRSLMMLRGTKQGNINWVATAMNQKDMEFIQARNFNKEEIFGIFAPGLASWLAINSTEANSKTGKEAFLELGVWPMHQAIAEKITLSILPSYGENLVAEFTDVRPQNIEIKLKELQAYERTHTIEEIRAKHYGDDPIGDDRDGMLLSEVVAVRGGGGMQDGRDPINKAKESKQFKRYVERRLAEGKPEKISAFKFNYMDDTEQERIKIELVPSEWLALEKLNTIKDELRAEWT